MAGCLHLGLPKADLAAEDLVNHESHGSADRTCQQGCSGHHVSQRQLVLCEMHRAPDTLQVGRVGDLRSIGNGGDEAADLGVGGLAEVILIVEGGTIQYFVDGEQIFIRRDQKKLTGYLAYAISSGTNADFGTRCIFTDTEIWSLEP